MTLIPAPRLGRRMLAAGCALISVPTLFPAAPAAAEPYPVPQHVAYGADWTEGLRPEDLSPSRAAICVVDSGVAVTPDTPADDPNGPILLRTSADGTMPGTPPVGSGPAGDHGTYMAAAAIAPRNHWGTVGLHPLGQIVSVRAMRDGETTISTDGLRQGINQCVGLRANVGRMVAISLSMSRSDVPDTYEQLRVEELVRSAQDSGIAVVGAAGNTPDASTSWPANARGVVAVAAADGTGAPCPYATIDDRVDIRGPGCGVLEDRGLSGESVIDNDGGSSMASVWFAEAIALLCDLNPALSGEDARAALLDGGRSRAKALNVEAAARRTGSGAIVDRARGRLAVALSEAPASAAPLPQPIVQLDHRDEISSAKPLRHAPRLILTQARARWRRGFLTVSVQGRRAQDSLEISAFRGTGRSRRRMRRRTRHASTVTVRLQSRPTIVVVRLRPPRAGSRRPSLSRTLTVVHAQATRGEFR